MADSGSDMVETDVESHHTVVAALPTVALSSGTGSKGAWDDRELINAYDAAMEEFHLHHPGPGSWLDKAMAAQRKGLPLPGAQSSSSAWYSASAPEPVPPTVAAEPPTKKRKTAKTGHQLSSASKTGPSVINPYAPVTNADTPNGQSRRNGQGRKSPAYAPPSPPNGDVFNHDREQAADQGAEEQNGQYDENEWYDQSYALTAADQGQEGEAGESGVYGEETRAQVERHEHGGYGGFGPPNFGPSQAVSEVGAIEAMGYAMTAQYWAGYWMGVAQAKTSASTSGLRESVAPVSQGRLLNGQVQAQQGESSRVVDQPEVAQNGRHQPSNLFVTRKNFTRPNGIPFNR